MQPSMTPSHILISLFYALLPLAGFVAGGIICQHLMDQPYDLICLGAGILLGLLSAVLVFRSSYSRGILKLIGKRRNLAIRLDAKTYVLRFNNGAAKFKGGSIRFWGDHKGRNLDGKNEIDSVYFDVNDNLSFKFSNGNYLTVANPGLIHESANFLKICGASLVKWEWVNPKSDRLYYFEYTVGDNGIDTSTNSGWNSNILDIAMGQSAVYMVANNE